MVIEQPGAEEEEQSNWGEATVSETGNGGGNNLGNHGEKTNHQKEKPESSRHISVVIGERGRLV